MCIYIYILTCTHTHTYTHTLNQLSWNYIVSDCLPCLWGGAGVVHVCVCACACVCMCVRACQSCLTL